MTENMKTWLKNLYLQAANDHFETGKFEHNCALGSSTSEMSTLHEMNADEHRAFGLILKQMSEEI